MKKMVFNYSQVFKSGGKVAIDISAHPIQKTFSLLFMPVVKLLSHSVMPCCLNVKLLVQNLATTLKLISLGVRLLGMA
jgi:hypothetical protein